MTGILGYNIATTPSRLDLMWVWFILVLACCLALNAVLWLFRGEEILSFMPDKIEILHRGALLKTGRKIDYTEIDSIDFNADDDTFLLLRIWGFGGGKIRINYLGRNTGFGQDLKISVAGSMVNEMAAEFEKRKRSLGI